MRGNMVEKSTSRNANRNRNTNNLHKQHKCSSNHKKPSTVVLHQRTKHIEIDIHTIRDKVLGKQVKLDKIDTKLNMADIFTKTVTGILFLNLRKDLGMRNLHASKDQQLKETAGKTTTIHTSKKKNDDPEKTKKTSPSKRNMQIKEQTREGKQYTKQKNKEQNKNKGKEKTHNRTAPTVAYVPTSIAYSKLPPKPLVSQYLSVRINLLYTLRLGNRPIYPNPTVWVNGLESSKPSTG